MQPTETLWRAYSDQLLSFIKSRVNDPALAEDILQDVSVDVIISNCVVNLSPDKPQVYREAFRVLKSGGRLAISDVVAFGAMPDEVLNDLRAYTGCMAGASVISDLETILKDAGFTNICITPKDESREVINDWAPGTSIADYVASANVEAIKP